MSWLMARIYDRFMEKSEVACLAAWRRELLSDLSGDVLEIGAGTGRNLAFYPPLRSLVVTEPDPHMRRQLAERARDHGMPVEVREDSVEALALADASFDAVISTLVLCSVPDCRRALAEIHRVLRPGGRLVFLEHVAAEEHSARRAWQGRIEPVWKHLADGCHLTRSTDDDIRAAGFELWQIERESMRKALPIVRPTIRGVALRPAE